METVELKADEKIFERNLGYLKDLKDNNGRDPFECDANGFMRHSITHNAYKMKINVEYGRNESLRAALVAVQSGPHHEGLVDLFACPQCELCFVHPKRFLIHLKWHNFGFEYDNIFSVASQNNYFSADKMAYYCFCSETFFSIIELGDHVRQIHGSPELDVLATTKSVSAANGSNRPKINFDKNVNKRKSYSVEYKKTIVEQSHGKNLTVFCKENKLDYRMVTRWRKVYDTLCNHVNKGDARRHKVGEFRKALFPELEDRVVKWIYERLARAFVLRRCDIQEFARQIATEFNVQSEHFKASSSWLDNLLRRNHLSLKMKRVIKPKR